MCASHTKPQGQKSSSPKSQLLFSLFTLKCFSSCVFRGTYWKISKFGWFNGFCGRFFSGHAHLTDFNIATIIKDGERATALAGTKPYMGNVVLQRRHSRPVNHVWFHYV